jgi:hypothetical protein
MPRKESRIMDQHLQFLATYQKQEMSVADLCREYEISRPTAYQWINRYNEMGPEGLVDRSRRQNSCSHATLERIENATRCPDLPGSPYRHQPCESESTFSWFSRIIPSLFHDLRAATEWGQSKH